VDKVSNPSGEILLVDKVPNPLGEIDKVSNP
jgi:hypothetical protein